MEGSLEVHHWNRDGGVEFPRPQYIIMELSSPSLGTADLVGDLYNSQKLDGIAAGLGQEQLPQHSPHDQQGQWQWNAHGSVKFPRQHYSVIELCYQSLSTAEYLDDLYSSPKRETQVRDIIEKLPFECIWCQRRFKTAKLLKTHERVHAGERSFTCKDCGKCFSQMKNLIKHERIHSGENPFAWQYCEKSFRLKQRLELHQRTHTAKRLYQCGCCEKSFVSMAGLTKHQHTHT